MTRANSLSALLEVNRVSVVLGQVGRYRFNRVSVIALMQRTGIQQSLYNVSIKIKSVWKRVRAADKVALGACVLVRLLSRDQRCLFWFLFNTLGGNAH